MSPLSLFYDIHYIIREDIDCFSSYDNVKPLSLCASKCVCEFRGELVPHEHRWGATIACLLCVCDRKRGNQKSKAILGWGHSTKSFHILWYEMQQLFFWHFFIGRLWKKLPINSLTTHTHIWANHGSQISCTAKVNILFTAAPRLKAHMNTQAYHSEPLLHLVTFWIYSHSCKLHKMLYGWLCRWTAEKLSMIKAILIYTANSQ